jgi:hypothetical protein
MSLDGFIAAAGHVMDWGAGRQLADFVGPDEFHEIAAATGAMLVRIDLQPVSTTRSGTVTIPRFRVRN